MLSWERCNNLNWQYFNGAHKSVKVIKEVGVPVIATFAGFELSGRSTMLSFRDWLNDRCSLSLSLSLTLSPPPLCLSVMLMNSNNPPPYPSSSLSLSLFFSHHRTKPFPALASSSWFALIVLMNSTGSALALMPTPLESGPVILHISAGLLHAFPLFHQLLSLTDTPTGSVGES